MCKYLVITDEGHRNESYLFEDEVDVSNNLKELGPRIVDILKVESVYVKEYENYIKYDNKTYYVGVNNIVEDEWYCSSVDKQYQVYVLAHNEKEAGEKAKEYVAKRYASLLASDCLEVAWVKKQNPIIRKEGTIKFVVEE